MNEVMCLSIVRASLILVEGNKVIHQKLEIYDNNRPAATHMSLFIKKENKRWKN
ncbi:hypothetical protein DSCW_59360 [Desulfosarcina widdelii]|uniref:Uncharacterized protein n=1 Tax=Desulfosarcina widdelii TaxID=947919 RepID=A0A5K7ZED9_9BACT|nr:hypothetical protein DSCW_59360 [Desulfosarcina widdelii]